MLEYLLKNNIPHFIAKYYVTSNIKGRKITDIHEVEFEVFILDKDKPKKTWYREPFYPRTKYRRLKRSEVAFFKTNQHLYVLELNNAHGRIYHPKDIVFDFDYARSVK